MPYTKTNFASTEVKVPEIWFKGQRVLRTLVQVGIPSFLAFATVVPAVIEALGLSADSEIRLWLIAVAAGITGVAAAITRVMAIPGVNEWLTKIGLGSVPAKAVDLVAEVADDPDAEEA